MRSRQNACHAQIGRRMAALSLIGPTMVPYYKCEFCAKGGKTVMFRTLVECKAHEYTCERNDASQARLRQRLKQEHEQETARRRQAADAEAAAARRRDAGRRRRDAGRAAQTARAAQAQAAQAAQAVRAAQALAARATQAAQAAQAQATRAARAAQAQAAQAVPAADDDVIAGESISLVDAIRRREEIAKERGNYFDFSGSDDAAAQHQKKRVGGATAAAAKRPRMQVPESTDEEANARKARKEATTQLAQDLQPGENPADFINPYDEVNRRQV